MNDPVIFVAFQTSSRANGGLESLTQILKNLERPRIVVTQRESDFTRRWRGLGCEVHVVQVPEPLPLRGAALHVYRMRRTPALARSNLLVMRLVRERRATVVHCNDPSAFWYGGMGGRLAGANVVLSVRDTRSPGAVYGFRWRMIRHLSREIVVLSQEMKAEVDGGLVPFTDRIASASTRAIYSAIDLDRMSAAASERSADRRAVGIERDVLAIGYIATFNEKKDQLSFLQKAAQPLLSADPAVRLYFVGDFRPESDGYASRCLEAARATGFAERITFVGYSDAPERWYRALDIVCLASQNEGLARGMIESLACGTPVVSFDVSSAHEILTMHECGRVVPRGNYGALVETLLALAGDTNVRRALGDRGAIVARDLFEPRRSVAEYTDLYDRLGGDSR